MKLLQPSKPYLIERIISAATYFTVGGVGFVWLIIAALAKKRVTSFLMYHILQSIFISILSAVVLYFLNFISVIILKIPIINRIPDILNNPIYFLFNMSILQLFSSTVILYLVITSFMGYYSYLPWVSDIIKGNTSNM